MARGHSPWGGRRGLRPLAIRAQRGVPPPGKARLPRPGPEGFPGGIPQRLSEGFPGGVLGCRAADVEQEAGDGGAELVGPFVAAVEDEGVDVDALGAEELDVVL